MAAATSPARFLRLCPSAARLSSRRSTARLCDEAIVDLVVDGAIALDDGEELSDSLLQTRHKRHGRLEKTKVRWDLSGAVDQHHAAPEG